MVHAFSRILLIASLGFCLPAMTAVAADVQKRSYVIDVQPERDKAGVQSVSSEPLDGDQNQVSVVTTDGKRRNVTVELTTTIYKVKLANNVNDKVKEDGFFCYELWSKDKAFPYTWYTWSRGIFGRFRLFTLSDGNTYLTWVHFSSVYFANVSQPMKDEAKMSMVNAALNNELPGIESIYVGGMIDPTLLVDKDTTAHYYSIYVTSLKKQPDGGFEIQLHGPDPTKTYTIVSDKKAESGWRLAE